MIRNPRNVSVRPTRLLPLLIAASMLSACASSSVSDATDPASKYDPWESMNRSIYRFNVGLDKVSTKPLAKGYRTVTPTIVRQGISNFFDNLTTPRSALTNFLQGKAARGFNEIGRFVFNSTLGAGGLIDIAELGGMQRYDEDFAQTFAVWGLPEGPYLILPILGSHSLLAAVAIPFDFYSDRQVRFENTSLRDKLYGLRLIDARQRLLAAERLLEDSQDPYITLREAYKQNREYKIYDGDPPVEDDYYEFYDEEE